MSKLQLKIDILKIRIKTLKKVRLDIAFSYGTYSRADSLYTIDAYIKDYQNKLIKLLEKKSKIKF